MNLSIRTTRPDEQVVDYINALADAVRETGCRKPIFYNGWGNRLAAVQQARVDGSSFGWYPSGLVAGHSLRRNFLPMVNTYGGSNVLESVHAQRGARAQGEDHLRVRRGGYSGQLHLSRHGPLVSRGRAQIATQFQYDPLPLARLQPGLANPLPQPRVRPQKAVSFLIAGGSVSPPAAPAGLRSLSSQFTVRTRPSQLRRRPERVGDAAGRSSIRIRRSTSPPSPDSLERIIGCGDSPLVTYHGTGAYFLEKLVTGAWRLEVYPDAVWIADPYGPHSLAREVVRILLARVAHANPAWTTWVTSSACGP